MTKIATGLQRDAKKNSAPRFCAGETQILTSGGAFFVALRNKKQGGQNRKNPLPGKKIPLVRHKPAQKNGPYHSRHANATKFPMSYRAAV